VRAFVRPSVRATRRNKARNRHTHCSLVSRARSYARIAFSQKCYALSKPPSSADGCSGLTLAPPSVPHPRTIHPNPMLSLFQDVTNSRTASRAMTSHLSGVVKHLDGTTLDEAGMATPAKAPRLPGTPAPWRRSASFATDKTANGSTNPSDEEDSFDEEALDSDASAVVVVEEEEDPEDTLAMQEWFAMFRILDRLKSHVGRAGAVPVALRIDEVRDELNSILEGGELSLSTLRGCRDSLAGIEDEFVHVQPAVASPHPKHKLSIQNKETRLLQSLGVILSTLRSLTDPIVRSRATPPLRTNSTNGRRTV
jgi:hypothetical protein